MMHQDLNIYQTEVDHHQTVYFKLKLLPLHIFYNVWLILKCPTLWTQKAKRSDPTKWFSEDYVWVALPLWFQHSL